MAVREAEYLARLIQELPDELIHITDKIRSCYELLRLIVSKLQRDAESKNRNLDALQNRTAELGELVEDLADLTTKATIIEPLVVKLEGSNTEHPKQPEKE